jgi:hypothetical protein
MTKPSLQAISSFWPIQLFYSLLAGLFFLPDFNPTLASTDGNQMGEGSLLAIDVAAGTNSLYLYIFLVTTCFFVLNKVIKRYELGRSQQFMEISTQIAWLGLFQVSYSDWVVRTLPIQARGVAGGLTVFTRTIGVVSAALLWLWSLEQVRLEALTAGLGMDEAFLKGFQLICWLSASLIALILIASGFVRHLWRAKTAL